MHHIIPVIVPITLSIQLEACNLIPLVLTLHISRTCLHYNCLSTLNTHYSVTRYEDIQIVVQMGILLYAAFMSALDIIGTVSMVTFESVKLMRLSVF